MAPYFHIFRSDSSWVVPLPEEGAFVVGSSSQADITLPETGVGGCRFLVVLRNNETLLRVTQTQSDGLAVNGEPLKHDRTLASGDVIQVGDVTLVYHDEPPARGSATLVELPRLREHLLGEDEAR